MNTTDVPYAHEIICMLDNYQSPEHMAEYDKALFNTAIAITHQVEDTDFLHKYFRDMYRFSLKEINYIIKYLNHDLPEHMRLTRISNKSKAKKISAITMFLANNQIDPELVYKFERLYNNVYRSNRGGSWGDDAFLSTVFTNYEQAFAERYPLYQ